MTSPPYWKLRDYGGYPGEIGAEPHWRDWLANLVECTAEMARVLKPEGSIWINLGDKFAGGWGGGDPKSPGRVNGHGGPPGAQAKSLLGLPWRYALACIDDLGLILRRDLIWSKPNPLPESVRDRAHTSHEYWFHLVKQPRYYAACDLLREPHIQPDRARADVFGGHSSANGVRHAGASTYTGPTNPLGRMPGSVWTVPTEPLPKLAHLDAEHYAAFGTEFSRRLILGWSPPGICEACGQGRFPVVDRRFALQPNVSAERNTDHGRLDASNGWGSAPRGATSAQIVGYACVCTPSTDYPERRGKDFHAADGHKISPDGKQHVPENYQRLPVREYYLDGWKAPPTRPAVVLDPFGGTGTVSHVARALGRIGISIELSVDYCRLAADPDLAAIRAAKVLGGRRPHRVISPDGARQEVLW